MSQYETTEQKASYGIGRQMGDQLARQTFEGMDITSIQNGLADSLQGKEMAVSADEINAAFQVITKAMQEAAEARSAEAISAGESFLADNAGREGITVTKSGLQYEVLTKGEGEVVSKDNTVRVHYHGTLVDGTVFDSSVARGEPAEFPVTGVIAGWVEALQLMVVGDKFKLYIPHDLAYGERGAGTIPPFSVLIFEVEVLAVVV
ncbi:FKBP-type peptidyl-prolyl cis-trans isomerase [Sansalvadorimonas sp. 2012CJ34-2]|uniref:Peptidyl-prolyl cis-trans isomerase n=1 Tax=Parendozoicomonas callyspongiae TaxID=2942213 RepID=A0ABT0PGI4_9GAMM|nr:FKBP-type peptidyl-prolyl cis-trans isomerase [Sansalvadorimonas sp. 2012CJ34-2]MCL6269872.1 FKBP-type peptidyl-prolyl cis-trans isomerase [Sansalvadorimonas sp. 2012CJ34-2]